MTLPDFAIIGAQKSGSTALMRHLGDHPQVFLPDHESRYFRDPWFSFQTPTDLEADVETSKPGVLRRGIKCPDLLAEEPCAGRMHDLLGDIPLIAVLREPVSRAISSYYWGMQWGWVPLADPAVGLMRILDGEYARTAPRAWETLEFGLYGKHLERYSKLFDPAQLYVTTDEKLRTDTEATLRGVFAHLDVDTDVPLAKLERSVNTGVYSMPRLKVLSLRHQHILREFPGHTGRYLQPPSGARGWAVDRSVAAVDRLVLSRMFSNDKPQVPAYVTHALADFYRDDITLLEQVTGQDFSDWKNRW